jgi:hypothetical protein
VQYKGGYGYKIRAGAAVEDAKQRAAEFLGKYGEDIQWVLRGFGRRSSAELELASTIVFADREAAKGSRSVGDLVRRVREVKPHFTEAQILAETNRLSRSGLLESVANHPN